MEEFDESYIVVSTLCLILSEVVDVLFGGFFSHTNSCQLPLHHSLRVGVAEACFELCDEVGEVLEDGRGVLSIGDCGFPVSEFWCLPVSPDCGVASLQVG